MLVEFYCIVCLIVYSVTLFIDFDWYFDFHLLVLDMVVLGISVSGRFRLGLFG